MTSFSKLHFLMDPCHFSSQITDPDQITKPALGGGCIHLQIINSSQFPLSFSSFDFFRPCHPQNLSFTTDLATEEYFEILFNLVFCHECIIARLCSFFLFTNPFFRKDVNFLTSSTVCVPVCVSVHMCPRALMYVTDYRTYGGD